MKIDICCLTIIDVTRQKHIVYELNRKQFESMLKLCKSQEQVKDLMEAMCIKPKEM